MPGHGLSLRRRLTTTSLLTNGAGYSISGGPGGLKIKSARDTIDIENLSSEIHAGEVFAFQRVGIDARQGFWLRGSPTNDWVIQRDG